jgi:hypothetical protein
MSTKADLWSGTRGRLMTGPCPTFEPETIRAMHMAFEEACDSLQLTPPKGAVRGSGRQYRCRTREEW